MALEGGILARRDDMVVIRGVDDVLHASGSVVEYRVEILTVRSMTEIRIEIEPEPAAGEGLAHHWESALRDALGLRIPVHIVGTGTLPRFEMKAKRWVRTAQ